MGKRKIEIPQDGDRNLCSWEKVAVSLCMDLAQPALMGLLWYWKTCLGWREDRISCLIDQVINKGRNIFWIPSGQMGMIWLHPQGKERSISRFLLIFYLRCLLSLGSDFCVQYRGWSGSDALLAVTYYCCPWNLWSLYTDKKDSIAVKGYTVGLDQCCAREHFCRLSFPHVSSLLM